MRLAALLLPLLAACSGPSNTDTSSTEGTGDAAAGADVYASNCAGCHGVNGEGSTGPAMADEVPSKSDAELENLITNGIGDMPPVPLDAQDMDDLLAYLRENYG